MLGLVESGTQKLQSSVQLDGTPQLSYLRSGHVSELQRLASATDGLRTINSPLGPCSSINLLISEACGIAGTSGCSSTTVDSDLQAEVMNFGSGAVDAVRKLGTVWNDASGGVVTAFLDGPAIIKVHILVTDVIAHDIV